MSFEIVQITELIECQRGVSWGTERIYENTAICVASFAEFQMEPDAVEFQMEPQFFHVPILSTFTQPPAKRTEER